MARCRSLSGAVTRRSAAPAHRGHAGLVAAASTVRAQSLHQYRTLSPATQPVAAHRSHFCSEPVQPQPLHQSQLPRARRIPRPWHSQQLAIPSHGCGHQPTPPHSSQSSVAGSAIPQRYIC